jgi:hypothetical protein
MNTTPSFPVIRFVRVFRFLRERLAGYVRRW